MSHTTPEFFTDKILAARRFYLNLNPTPGVELEVVCGGFEQVSREYAVQRESFGFFCLEYVVRGHGSVRLGRTNHVLQPGSVFAYGPGISHDIRTRPDDALVKYFVDFSGSRAAALLEESGLKSGSCRRVFPPNSLQPIWDEIISVGLKPAANTQPICVRLLECLGLKIADSRGPATTNQSLSFDTYQKCRRHLEEHFMRLHTQEQLAQECHLDTAYLCRLFRRYDHETPYRMLLRLKIGRAAEWLLQPGTLVKQVAERAGFADAFHFSKTFKSVMGVSPETFRSLR